MTNFPHRDHDIRILVTGCQMSGTRFWAKYLADAFGVPYLDENDYGIFNYERLRVTLQEIELGTEKGWCVHGPAMKWKVKELVKVFPDVRVVWMTRDVQETVISMFRKGWKVSAITEIARLLELAREYDLASFTWEQLYIAVTQTSRWIGQALADEGLVDVVWMGTDISHADGFVNRTKELMDAEGWPKGR